MIRPLSDSDRKAGWIEVTTIAECIDRAAAEWGHDAVSFPHEKATYPEFAARIDHLARGLIGLGIGRGDKVGILLPQGIDYLALFNGIAKVGAIAVPINARFKSRELNHVIIDSDMRALFTSSDQPEFVDWPGLIVESLPSLAEQRGPQLRIDEAPELHHLIDFGGSARRPYLTRADFDDAAAAVVADAVEVRRYQVRVRDTAAIMYTSGTTANPKGAMLSHEALIRKGLAVARTRLGLTSDDRVWAPLPLYHIGGIAFSYACFTVGATYCHSSFFDPDSSLRQLEEERCTVALPSFETIWLAILNHPDFSSADLSALRLVFNVGVPERLRQMQDRLPDAPQVSGYGSTEACAFLTLGEADDPLEARINTAGRPLAGLEVRIVDPKTGRDLGQSEVGEIVFRGWSNFDGYYKDSKRTDEAIDADGWFRSGDLGTMDDEGRLTFVTRLKDMLKVGGENVAAAEIEGYLITHPAVMMAQVVAAPDARYVEVPAAYLVLEPGQSVTEQEIIDYCLGQIATFKVPRYVRVVDEWPMSGTKIKKYVLRERLSKELRDAGIDEAPKLAASV